MRLARVVSAHDQRNPALDRLVETAELDVLQLDYVWPNIVWPKISSPSLGYAAGLLQQMQTLHKTIFLDPKLHLVTNAGGGDPRGCVEALAEYLCEHGDAKLPITAVRGDNVLPCLEELMAAGIELKDIATGMTLHELKQPPLAAQVELGAGPLAIAWEDGARLVVAGCYDLAAPMIATAVSALGWSGDQTNRLAIASTFSQVYVDIDQNGGLSIFPQAGVDVEMGPLRQRLLEAEGDSHATSDKWLLRVAYQDGYCAEALLECRDVSTGEKAASELQALIATAQLDLLSPQEGDGPSLLRLRFSSQKEKPCLDFVSEVTRFSLQSKVPGCELTGTRPSCQPKRAEFCCPVPRDAIVVSVDTRPAKEWR